MGCVKSIFKFRLTNNTTYNDGSIPFIHYEIYENYLKNYQIQKRFDLNEYVYKVLENNKPFILKIHYNKSSFNREVNILKRVKLIENTINLNKYIEFSNRQIIDGGLILYEYIPGVDLFTYLTNNTLSTKSKKKIFMKIVAIVQELHNNNILHGDIKLENIICKYNNYSELFIIDYGLSINCIPGTTHNTAKYFGTVPYIAPEMYNYTFSLKSDIWSLGNILYMLIFDKTPFTTNNRDYKRVVNNIEHYITELKNMVVDNVEPDIFELLFGMLEVDEEKRFDISEVSNNKWLNN